MMQEIANHGVVIALPSRIPRQLGWCQCQKSVLRMLQGTIWTTGRGQYREDAILTTVIVPVWERVLGTPQDGVISTDGRVRVSIGEDAFGWEDLADACLPDK